MYLQVGYELLYDCPQPTPMILMLNIHSTRAGDIVVRFVSGYIFVPDVHHPATVGGGATHAWMQVYLPGAGWVDFDPANNIVGNRNLIRVAVAWDPRQALPLWGSFIGSTSSFRGMEVEVSVTEENGCASVAKER